MKSTRYIFMLSAALLLTTTSVQAQLDSRNRTVETIIIDNLGQLPAKDAKQYAQSMSEIAATGEKGITQLAGMLGPAATTKNATFEYAINSVTDFVMQPGNDKYRDGVRKGLIAGLEKCTDNANKAFLLTQLQKCATAKEAAVFEKYLGDDYLKDYAVRGLAATPGINSEILSLMRKESAPKTSLAYIAYFKKIKEAEPVLLAWAKSTLDKPALTAIYKALTTCGSDGSIEFLGKTAKQINFADDATGVTNAYLTLLSTCTYDKLVNKAAKELVKNPRSAIRCAGLRLLMKSENQAATTKTVLAALKDNDIQYRNTALDFAKEYAGTDIFQSVANKYKGLADGAKIDVLRWFGNNHVKEQTDLVNNAMTSTNTDVAQAAIKSAGQIGGEKALTALIGQLSGSNAQAASNALLAFNGKINDGVAKALDSRDTATQKQALKLASERRIYSTYPKVLALTSSTDRNVSETAYDALGGVSSANNFDELCNLMEKAEGGNATKLQKAALSAIAAQTANQQYNLIANRLTGTSKAALYYPLLAQAGNDKAIEKLMQEYKTGNKAEAQKALIKVDNPEMIGVLYSLAKDNNGQKDDILQRYIALVKQSKNTEIKKYLLYRQALDLNPSTDIQKSLISALGETKVVPALKVVGSYLDNDQTKQTAASAVKALISKTADLQGGKTEKALLEKTKDVYQTLKSNGNPDAGYAIDEISQLQPKLQENGFEPLQNKKYENFELYADFKGQGTVIARSAEVVKLGAEEIKFVGEENKLHADKNSWNNIYVKVVNDRIFVNVNGEKLVENAILKNVNPTGLVQIKDAETRDVQIKELPSTPVFTLSAEEKKQGFEVLFDGRSLDKWHGNTTGYVPVDGNIYVTANYGGSGNLYSNKKYSDFIFRFEFFFDVPGVNNGIGIRTKEDVDAAYDGMEIQILDHDDPIYKGLFDYQEHGSVYGILIPKHFNFGPIKQWHTEEIRAIGDHITVTVDGQVITDGNIREACQGHNVSPDGSEKNPYTADHKNHIGLFNKDGYISFCGHGPGVKFRNVRILDLSKNAKKTNTPTKHKKK